MTNDNNNQELIELLSAYLDNELSEHQQEKISQLIASDRQVQALFDSLRRTSEAVTALPVQKIPRDLTDDVLYDLERDTLLEGNDDSSLMIGERHLRIRNFVGAAVIVMLVSAVSVAIYSAIKTDQPSPTGEPFAVVNTEKDGNVDRNVKSGPSELADQQQTGLTREKNDYGSEVALNSFRDVPEFLGIDMDDKPKKDTSADNEKTLSVGVPSTSSGKLPDKLLIANPQHTTAGQTAIKKVQIPAPNYVNIKLETEITASDKLTIERIKYFAARHEGGFFSFGQEHTLALICRADELENLYYSLREILPGTLTLCLTGVNPYQSVRVSDIAANELLPLTSITKEQGQLAYLKSVLPAERILATTKTYISEPPLWRQVAMLAPNSQQEALAQKYKPLLEPYLLTDNILPEPNIGTQSLPATSSVLKANVSAKPITTIIPGSRPTEVQKTVDFVAIELILRTQQDNARPSDDISTTPATEKVPVKSLPLEGRIQFGPTIH